MPVQIDENVVVIEEQLQSVSTPKRKRDVLKTKKGVAAVSAGVAVAAGVVTGAIVGGKKLVKKIS